MEAKKVNLTSIRVGAQSFAEIINDGLIYVDKTKLVWELARTDGISYFLSRPRKFGKTLLLDTFEELFKGPANPREKPKGLFDGLWIGGEEAAYDFNDTFPVIRLSMTMASFSTDALLKEIKRILANIAVSHGLEIEDAAPGGMLSLLITAINEKYNKKVILLIDEYDDPISSNIGDKDLAMDNFMILRDFYSPLKSLEKILRFVFITGVTRNSLLSQSSVLNHLNDITMDKKYADICGFTHEEFKSRFAPYFPAALKAFKENGALGKKDGIADLVKKELAWYDGYSWDGKTRVLNPHSLLNSFIHSEFDYYWASNEPSESTLTSIMLKNPLVFTADKLRNLSDVKLKLFDIVGSSDPIPSLFHTGYLTLAAITRIDTIKYYSFKAPNEELKHLFVREFSTSLFKFLNIDTPMEIDAFSNAIKGEDSKQLTTLIDSFFGTIPSALHIPKEAYYHSALYGYLTELANFHALPESPWPEETPDMILNFADGLRVIVELKYKNADTKRKMSVEKANKEMEKLAVLALKTIDRKEYSRPYIANSRKLLRLGVGVYGKGRARAILENETQTLARREASRKKI